MKDHPTSSKAKDSWSSGDKYEPYIGRWSRLAAQEFLPWLEVPKDSHWVDVGCGTGALSQTILQVADPAKIKAVDSSDDFVAFAQLHTHDQRVGFEVGDAQALTFESGIYDAVVSSLMLNFIPQPERAVAEMTRIVREGGVVAAYLWDYAGKMQLLRHFWNAATALDPYAYDLDEGRRFPICQPKPLGQLFEAAGLHNVEVRPIDIPTDFQDFDDYWAPFLGGQGPAPVYLASLGEEHRIALQERLRASLPFALDGSIPLVARVWAVKGICLD